MARVNEASDDSSEVVWFFAGALVGAAVALLYAPQSGDETRRLLRKQAGKGRDYLAERGRDAMDQGRNLYERGRNIADETASMFERGRQLIED